MSNGATDTMLSVIPVVVLGGITLKLAENLFPKVQSKPKSKREKRNVYGRSYSGDFSNVGF